MNRTGVYVTFAGLDDESLRGVVKKMEGHIAVFSEAGLRVDMVAPSSSGVRIVDHAGSIRSEKPRGALPARLLVCRLALEHAIAERASFAYIRFQYFDPSVYRLLK